MSSYPKNRGFNRFMESVLKSPYKLLDKYIDSTTKLRFDCEKHGIFSQSPQQFNIAIGCKKCAYDLRSKAHAENRIKKFIETASKIHPELDFSMSNYVDTYTPIDFRCSIHGIQSNIPMYIIQGTGCKKCSPKSKGEEKIANLLDKMKINYIREKKYKDCVGIGGLPLRFDFFIPEFNTLIEFDGQQHFIEASGKWLGATPITKIHDKIKDKYCYDNGIDLYRIPYYKIDRILDILLHLRRCCKI